MLLLQFTEDNSPPGQSLRPTCNPDSLVVSPMCPPTTDCYGMKGSSVWSGNEIYNNSLVGINPQDNSDYMTLTRNHVRPRQ